MGTLKSVCSSWFVLISRDIYKHTHTLEGLHCDAMKESSLTRQISEDSMLHLMVGFSYSFIGRFLNFLFTF